MAMRFLIRLLIVILAFSGGESFAFQKGSPKIHMDTDLARFRGDSAHVYVEVYFSFDVSQMKFVRLAGGYQSEIFMNVYFVRSANDSIVARDVWRIPFSADDTMLLQTSRSYADVAGFFLKPDIYRLYIVGKDINDLSRSDSLSYLLTIAPIDTGASSLSDIELCTSIAPTERDSLDRFYKNTYDVRPNPSKIFGAGQPVLFYYIEAYKLLSKSSDRYSTRAVVTNVFGKEVISREQIKRRANESSVEVGLLKINTLQTGSYTFSFILGDSTGASDYTMSKRFFIYNPSLPPDTTARMYVGGVLGTEYATMTESDLDHEFDMARYTATSNEIAQYRKLNGVDAKRKALFYFWVARDVDKSTPENEFKKQYMERVDYADQHFAVGQREGWKTDRGRVFIVYGPPDEVERHANEIDMKPYEIWYYHSIQGGVEFDFGDKSGFSDYVLLNSTHRDELHDDNWQSQLKIE